MQDEQSSKPATPPAPLAYKLPGQPWSIRITKTKDEDQSEAEAHQLLRDQVAISRKLNWITGVGAAISILSVLGLVGSLYLTKKAVSESGSQTKILRNQMILDERPYIKLEIPFFSDIDTNDKILEPIAGKALVVTIAYSNVGRSPAVNFRSAKVIRFGAKAQQGFTSQRIEPEIGSITVLPTGSGSTSAISREDENVQSGLYDPRYTTPWNGDKTIVLLARFYYGDAFGSEYCTEDSLLYSGKGQWHIVASHPDPPCIDRPKLEP